MTRAKDDLTFLTSEDNVSTFVDDLKRPKKRIIKKKGKTERPKAVIKERGLKAAQKISSP